MGYYSDVKCVTTKEGWEALSKAVKEVTTDDNEPLTEQGAPIGLVDDKYILAEWYYIKWYEEFKDVNTFMETLDKLEDKGIPFQFMRVGENFEDVEHRTCFGKDWKASRDMPHLELTREIAVEY